MISEKIIVLLADDDDDDRDFFNEALEHIQFAGQLVTVNNGEKVIDFLKKAKRPPDFVFLDINMPRLNGIECLKFIKEAFPSPDFHVIMLSTAIAPHVVEQSYMNGASLYIQKPSKFSELAKYLHYCLTQLENSIPENNFILNERLKSL